MMKVGIYVAHDDDSVLGMGGRIVQHLKANDQIYLVIFTDGRNSHKAILGIESNPSVWEVKEKRAEEIKMALKILGVPKEKLYFLELIDGEGQTWQDLAEVRNQVTAITLKEKPNLVYFHFPDGHIDHRAVDKVMLKVLENLNFSLQIYKFFIWAFDGILAHPLVRPLVKLWLSKAHPEIDVNQIPKIPRHALRINIKKEELGLKREAITQLKSQVEIHPYPDWQVQKRPILEEEIIKHCLRGEEIFVKV